MGTSAGELPGGLPHGGGGLRLEEIRHRLRLGQIQFSVEEGPLGELLSLIHISEPTRH